MDFTMKRCDGMYMSEIGVQMGYIYIYIVYYGYLYLHIIYYINSDCQKDRSSFNPTNCFGGKLNLFYLFWGVAVYILA